MPDEREVMDVDDPDVLCTGMRHCIRIVRPPEAHRKRRARHSPSHDPCTELQRITQLELEVRRAIQDLHPAKKRATDALRMATHAVHLKRKEAPTVIEISSDSEHEPLSVKKQKIEEPTESPHLLAGSSADPAGSPKYEPEPSTRSPSPQESSLSDDDDYINLLATLDISNEANWVPISNENKAEDLAPSLEFDDEPPKPPLFRLPRKKPHIDYRHVPVNWFSLGSWGMVSNSGGIRTFPKPFWHARRQDSLFPRRSPNLYHENGFTKFELIAQYPHLMSGGKPFRYSTCPPANSELTAVNKVIQAHGTVVLCSVVQGGAEDSDDDDDDDDRPLPQDNKPGSLVVYRNGRKHVAPAHRRLRNASRGSVIKHYTVDDVVFNPRNPLQFISSGHDSTVQIWEIVDGDEHDEHESLSSIRQIAFDSSPHDLVYNPDNSALAITYYDGTVRVYSQDLFEDMLDVTFSPRKFYAGPKGSGHAAGATLWGLGPSNHMLFTSSEPAEKNDYTGFHHAFDARRGHQIIKFDATEAGDNAALSPDGATLALFTRGKDGKPHPVRLYDVRRKAKEAYETEELEKFHVRPIIGHSQDDLEEVTRASFSPDGRLLAVGRSDNALHVYDVRALSRGPLCQFEHHDSDSVGGGGFGIVAATWIQGRSRLGIVSGGNDGCVRLWEPALGESDVQGAVIGRTDFDVSHFSIGDRQNGEFPLVIGDAGGAMHTYDFTNPDGVPI